VRLSATGIIFSNHNFAESIIEIRATVWDGDMIIDHPYAIFMSRSAATEYNVVSAVGGDVILRVVRHSTLIPDFFGTIIEIWGTCGMDTHVNINLQK
jgi:hypothetical protein